jgi:hypothetical protein
MFLYDGQNIMFPGMQETILYFPLPSETVSYRHTAYSWQCSLCLKYRHEMYSMSPLSHKQIHLCSPYLTKRHELMPAHSHTRSGDECPFFCPIASTFETDGRFTPLFMLNTDMRLPHLYVTHRMRLMPITSHRDMGGLCPVTSHTDMRLKPRYVTYRHKAFASLRHTQIWDFETYTTLRHPQTWGLCPLRSHTYLRLHSQTWDLRPFTSQTYMRLTPLYVTHKHQTYDPLRHTDMRLTPLYVTYRHESCAPLRHTQTWDLRCFTSHTDMILTPLYVSHRLETYSPLRHTQTWDLRCFTSHTDMRLTPLYVTHRHESYAPSPSYTDMSLSHTLALFSIFLHTSFTESILRVNIGGSQSKYPQQISCNIILGYSNTYSTSTGSLLSA